MSRWARPGHFRRPRSRAAAPLVVLLLGLAACTPAPEPDAAPDPSSLADRVAASDDLLTTSLADDEPGCSAAVAVRGEVVWAGARGLADVETGDPISTTTEFDIASVSKQFTAMTVLLLADDGDLALDDPLSLHVGGLPAWAADVALDDLIHHTSGIPDYTDLLVAQGAGLDEPTSQQDAVDAMTLAAEAAESGLIDEYGLRVHPVLVGGGTPFFPRAQRRADLELVGRHTFNCGVMYLRYRVSH